MAGRTAHAREGALSTRIRKAIETLTGLWDDKREWGRAMARLRALPDGYREGAEAVRKYLSATVFTRAVDGSWSTAYADLAELFEQAAAAGTPVREVVGEGPVAFAEAFADNYPEHRWIDTKRRKLTERVDHAIRADTAHQADHDHDHPEATR